MKFLVDELPLYGDPCPFQFLETDIYPCPDREGDACPIHWDKYKVSDAPKPRECYWLKEGGEVNENNKGTR